MTRIELPAPVPLSACFTNVAGRGRVPTKRYLAWQNEALWMIMAQKAKPVKGRRALPYQMLGWVYFRFTDARSAHSDAGRNGRPSVCEGRSFSRPMGLKGTQMGKPSPC